MAGEVIPHLEEKFLSSSPQQTEEIGLELGKRLKKNDIVAFIGDLAAGKTTFIKGIAKTLEISSYEVTSPTFVYLNIYEGKDFPLHHFDLYRIKNEEEFLARGFLDYFSHGIILIEWADRICSILPNRTISITMDHVEESKRAITITWQKDEKKNLSESTFSSLSL